MFTSQLPKYRNVLASLCFVAAAIVLLAGALGWRVHARSLSQHEGDIVINEIMYDPNAVSDYLGEWIEIVNLTGSPIDMDSWCIKDASANGQHSIDSANGTTTVPANGYLVLGREDDTNTNGGAPVDYKYGTVFLLNQTGDTITLCSDGCTCNNVEDTVTYDNGSGWPSLPSSAGKSIEFCFGSQTNNAGSNWLDAETIWTGSAGDKGSPGSQNDCTESGTPTIIRLLSIDAKAKAGKSVWLWPIVAAILAGAGIGFLILRRDT